MRRRLFLSMLILLVAPSAIAATRECVSDRDCMKGYTCRGDEHSTRCEALVCSAEVSPVCGLDGRTYSNSCIAALQGVGVAYQGVCGRCGGLAGRQCAPWEFCDFDPGVCKMSNGEGTCRTTPSVCAQEQHLVCGCDGRNYANDCIRMMSRVPLAHDGPCVFSPKAKVSGPAKPNQKPGGRKTTRPRASSSSASERCPEPGGKTVQISPIPVPPTPPPSAQQPPVVVIEQIPEAETQHIKAGKAESATESGIPVAGPEVPEGSQQSSPTQAECHANNDCPRGQYCFWKVDGKCGSDGKPGVCRGREEVKICRKEETNLVCGCDGNTYTNSCWASAVGQSVKKPGACTDEKNQ